MSAHILEAGLCTPLGLCAAVNEAEFAAGSLQVGETDVADPRGTWVRASRLGRIKPQRKRTARMASLAARAARDCLERLGGPRRPELPLYLGLPAEKSGGLVDAEKIAARVKKATMPFAVIETSPDQCFRTGRSAFFHALDAACRRVETGGGLALAGAVDSLCDRTTLTYLALSGRTLGFNPDGVIPGEAAGFVLVGREPSPPANSPTLKVVARALGEEGRHIKQSLPNLAAGLTGVFRSLRREAELGQWRPDHMIAGQSGERFYAMEFSCAYLRNARLLPEPLSGSLIAEWLGDSGAGAGVASVIAAWGWLKRRPPERPRPGRVLVYGCSDEGPIGGCVLEG